MSDITEYLSDHLDGSEITLIPVTTADIEDGTKVTAAERNWMNIQGFSGKKGSYCLIASKDGSLNCAFVGVGKNSPNVSDIWWLSGIASALPPGRYAVADEAVSDDVIKAGALGWCLGHYDFTIYKQGGDHKVRTLCTGGIGGLRLVTHIQNAVALVRDMVNTPTADMSPATLESIVQELAENYKADFTSICGDDLIEDFPAIHAVGRAAAAGSEPRLLELNWKSATTTDDSLKISIIGKGVCFDTGGLNLKTGGSMTLMKKDMGGAAHAIALASLIMTEELPIDMQLLIPAVENSVAGNAFRPGDVIDTRLGLTVEIGNTDAEGRLVLCDALALASEGEPDLILDFATLTGAARVALGPDLPATYSNDDGLWDTLSQSSQAVGDPLWRMPLWAPYDDYLASPIADLNNVSDGPYGGSITAALYLQRFVGEEISWVHFDTFAWNPAAKHGRPKGGDAQGMRAAYDMICSLIDAE